MSRPNGQITEGARMFHVNNISNRRNWSIVSSLEVEHNEIFYYLKYTFLGILIVSYPQESWTEAVNRTGVKVSGRFRFRRAIRRILQLVKWDLSSEEQRKTNNVFREFLIRFIWGSSCAGEAACSCARSWEIVATSFSFIPYSILRRVVGL